MSFIQAGNEAVRAALKARIAAERNKPKYDRFGKQAIQDQTAQDLLSMEIRGRAQQAAMAVKSNQKTREINREAEEFAKEQVRSAKMAGKLAGGAALIGSSYFMSKRKDEADGRISMLQDFIDKNNELGRRDQEEYNQRSTESPTETVSENDASTTSLSGSYPTPSSKETLSESFPKPISSGQAMSAGLGSYKGGPKATQAQMTKFAEQAGFSPENAKIMAAIAMGESGGRLKIDTVQSGLDPNMKNEFSVGATQINVQAHGDKLAKLGYTADDLRDPVKNFQVAKMVYDEMGSFSPWSVYKSGDYKQYLD
jgi:hypothetical protein